MIKRILKRTLSLVILSLICFSAFSQEVTAPKVTATFYNTDLVEALNEISLQTGITILTDQYVSGLVTADFLEVGLEKALNILLLPGGYSYKKIDENVYFVGLADPQSHNFLNLTETQVISLKYISVDKFLNLIPENLHQYIKTNKETNQIVVYAPQNTIDYINDLVEKLDKGEPYIELTVYIVETNERYSDLIKGNVFNINQEGIINSFSFTSPVIGFSIQDLFEAEIEMYEKNETANLVTKQVVNVLPGEQALLSLKNLNSIVFTTYRNEFRNIESGIEIEMTPTMREQIIQISFRTKTANLMEVKRDSYLLSESELETKVNLNPNEILLIADLDLSQLYSKSGGTTFLKDLPFFRFLFGDNQNQDESKRMMIFLTASPTFEGVEQK
ncbi:type II secretion system protein GspD [Petrotoga olearia]|uniref:Type II/III secretion system secretin-like domain-containing protein n=2 Tax=Petrotoga olearia TaxID=156203 RepID=A0A2K1P5T1_9BACT|nr:hypothetical protein [Petrotoga olearia]PNR98132.1 hypothetical protein X929_01610 [Petrotoga olearia DSM 13574]RMA75674.1 type IV pilus assembly protein PilQ [Petrotoga olearia]